MRVWLLMFFTASLGFSSIEDKETVEALVKSFKEGLGDVPDVDSMIKLVQLFTAKITGSNKEEVEFIRKCWLEIRAHISESFKRVKFPLALKQELKQVMEMDDSAETLMLSLNEVFKEQNINSEIEYFVQLCKQKDPFWDISGIDMAWPLYHHFRNDGHYSRTKLYAMKQRLYNTVNVLTLEYLFELYFSGDEKTEAHVTHIVKLKRRLDERQNATNKEFDDLLKNDYWSKMDKMVYEVILPGPHAKSELAIKADRISSSLSEIYTNDRFCFIVAKNRRNMPDIIVGPRDQSRDQLAYFNKEYLLVILRISKKNVTNLSATPNSFEEFQKNNGECFSKDQTKLSEYAVNNGVFVIGAPGNTFGPDTIMRCTGQNMYTSIPSTCSYGNSWDGKRTKDVTYHVIPNQY